MASLQKNVGGQNFTFVLIDATLGSGVAGATVSVFVAQDGAAQFSGTGVVTSLGSGQYNYAPTQSETNAIDVGFLFTATGVIPVNADFHTDLLTTNTASVLNSTVGAIARGTVTTGGSTISIPTSALTINGTAASGVVANQFVPRVVLFDGNTVTAGLQGAAAVISASTASNTPIFTTQSVLPATPVSGDTFSVV